VFDKPTIDELSTVLWVMKSETSKALSLDTPIPQSTLVTSWRMLK
jgi:hypothetical protein